MFMQKIIVGGYPICHKHPIGDDRTQKHLAMLHTERKNLVEKISGDIAAVFNELIQNSFM